MIIQDMQSLNDFVKLAGTNPQALIEIYIQPLEFWLYVNPEVFQVFCNTLTKCKFLQSLNLTDWDFAELPDNMLALLFGSISQCTNLENIKLSYCGLGKIYSLSKFEIVCNGIVKCLKLKTLDLSHNDLSLLISDCLRALGNALAKLQLVSINLSDNTLFDKGYRDSLSYTTKFTLFCNMISQCKTLQSINFKNNIASSFSSVVAECFPILGSALGQLPKLTSIDFSSNEFGKLKKADFQTFDLLLLPCKHLQVLILNFNHLDELMNYDGFQVLGGILSQCKMLTALHVLGNDLIFTENASQILCDALAQCELLTSVYGIEEDFDACRKPTPAFKQVLDTHRIAFQQMLEVHRLGLNYSNEIDNALQKALPQSFPGVIQDLIIESLLSPLLYQQSIHNRKITHIITHEPQVNIEDDHEDVNTAGIINDDICSMFFRFDGTFGPL